MNLKPYKGVLFVELPSFSSLVSFWELPEATMKISIDPLAYMNAFGFSAMPSYFGNTIPTYMSQDGVYERRAVRDRDTGEIRYVNVPIGNASLAGTGGFQRRRRAGFGGNFDNF